MRMTTIRRPLTALVAVAALLVAGCILSGQFVIVIPFADDIEATDSNVGSLEINLANVSKTWEEHADDIQNIVDLKFECKVTNNHGDSTAAGEVWISPTSVGSNPDADDVRSHEGAVLFLSGFELAPGADISITFKKSADYITNLESVLDIIEGGVFHVYGIANNREFNITISGIGDRLHGRIMVTFSAG
ncbi:MAG TPA: hypothetical protein VM118_12965 [Acidobacteriota bacterium]|nr:hypothetical protein [Acidobacteriota bacterium]